MAEFLVKYYRSLIFFTLTKEKITDDICNDPKCVLYPMHPGLGLVGGRERERGLTAKLTAAASMIGGKGSEGGEGGTGVNRRLCIHGRSRLSRDWDVTLVTGPSTGNASEVTEVTIKK